MYSSNLSGSIQPWNGDTDRERERDDADAAAAASKTHMFVFPVAKIVLTVYLRSLYFSWLFRDVCVCLDFRRPKRKRRFLGSSSSPSAAPSVSVYKNSHDNRSYLNAFHFCYPSRNLSVWGGKEKKKKITSAWIISCDWFHSCVFLLLLCTLVAPLTSQKKEVE